MKKLVLIFALFLCSCAVGDDARIVPQIPDAPLLDINELADLILESAEFPAMITYTEQSDIEIFLPGIDFSGIEEIILIQQALSVHLIEVVLIKPATGEAADFLRERQKTLREQLAFYPAQVLSAEASVVGNVHNIAFLICHEQAAEIENKLFN